MSERPRMRLVSWKPIGKGKLIGLATVELPNGLRIIDCPVFDSDTGPRAALPAKPLLNANHTQRLDAKGKAVYTPVMEWTSKDLTERFSKAILDLIPGLNGKLP